MYTALAKPAAPTWRDIGTYVSTLQAWLDLVSRHRTSLSLIGQQSKAS